MLTPKGIGGFALRVLGLYVLLSVVPGDAVRDAYGKVFRAAGNRIFGTFGTRGVVRFRLHTEGPEGLDTAVFCRVRPNPHRRWVTCRAWDTGWRPAATFLALMLATPIPWSRWWRALGWGIAAVHVFVVLRLLMLVIFGFCETPAEFGLFSPSEYWLGIIEAAFHFVSIEPAGTIMAPIFIWILVSFRRGDRAAIFGAPQQATA
ncbi:MAG: hypothetical protein IH987_13490 [Planctomycetes bacterium]|nr:hypothetical protein [Planctomycetota bacterium]